jgi:malate/lactate dehydrogenase
MVRIGIVGLGHVGSTLAFALLQVPEVTVIGAVDIDKKKEAGEIEDLTQAMMMLGIEDRIIIPDISNSEMLFICAGHPREYRKATCLSGEHFETDGALYDKNYPIVQEIVMNACAHDIDKNNIYIVTNPSTMIARMLGCHEVGETLDSMRCYSGCESGKWILQQKGFTNFGVVAECVEIVKNFISNRIQIK